MTATEFARLPWAALLIEPDGRLAAASSPVADLIGFTPESVDALEARVEVRTGAGILRGESLPWRRAVREGFFEESEVWVEPASGRRITLWIECRGIDGQRVLALHAGGVRPLERRSDAFLRALNDAVLAHPEALRLRDLLQRLVEQACELTGARYGAMGVLRRDRTDLKDFVFVGLPEAAARQIGRLPAGKGILGAVIEEARTIRIPRLADDPRAAGFPPHHPPMGPFLGVPLRIGGEVFGNFYLAKDGGAGEFTEGDGHLVEGLSAQAALTVAFARQLEDEQRQIFGAVVREAPHGMAFFPADPAEEVYGNAAAERLLGKFGTRSDDPGRTYGVTHPDGRPVRAEEFPATRALRGESVLNVALLVGAGTERQAHVLASAAPVRARGGELLGAVLVLQDVTSFVDLARLREEFAAVVAHDLRTPVHSVLMNVEKLLALASGEATSVPVATLQSMRHSSRQLSRLISDLLDASLIEARRLRVNARAVDLADLVSRAIQQLAILLHGRPVHVEVRGEPPLVHADPLRVEQVLSNLLENAAKYSDEGKPIHVTVEQANGGAALSVKDFGSGIDAADMPRLFDRYYQAQRARATRSGSGLGLYVVKGLVDAHGGKLAVESATGVGSVFRVWLPAAKPE